MQVGHVALALLFEQLHGFIEDRLLHVAAPLAGLLFEAFGFGLIGSNSRLAGFAQLGHVGGGGFGFEQRHLLANRHRREIQLFSPAGLAHGLGLAVAEVDQFGDIAVLEGFYDAANEAFERKPEAIGDRVESAEFPVVVFLVSGEVAPAEAELVLDCVHDGGGVRGPWTVMEEDPIDIGCLFALVAPMAVVKQVKILGELDIVRPMIGLQAAREEHLADMDGIT